MKTEEEIKAKIADVLVDRSCSADESRLFTEALRWVLE